MSITNEQLKVALEPVWSWYDGGGEIHEPDPLVVTGQLAKDMVEERTAYLAAMSFLRRCADGKHRIVSSGDLTAFQIAEAQADGRFYVEAGTGLGWALLPWTLTTAMDDARLPSSPPSPSAEKNGGAEHG